MNDECLRESEIAAYVDGALEAAEREKVENHLERCRLCLSSVAELKRLVDAYGAGPVVTPETALARARNIVREGAAPAPGLSIVAALHQGLVRILETTGNLLPPPRLEPVATRGGKPARLLPRVAKSLSGYLVTVELSEEQGAFAADISLVEEKTSERPEGVKVKLHAGGVSETRYSRSGKVRFASLAKGMANLDLEGIGRVRIEIQ